MIWSDNTSLKLVLTSTATITWINPTKAHWWGVYLLQYLYYGDSGGFYLLPSSIYSYSFNRCLTCPLLPTWLPASPTTLLWKGVLWTGDGHRVKVDPGEARPPPPPVSTLSVSLPKNRISKDDGSDEALLRCLKFSAKFSLSGSLLYSGVSSISIVPALTLQELGRLTFTAWQRAGRPSLPPFLSQNIVVH